jgi:5-methylcytosine-specific restriction endonuclease McrA
MSREYVPVALRRLVSDRARGYCEYCQSPGQVALESLIIEHIFPISRGGKTVAENLALACQQL